MKKLLVLLALLTPLSALAATCDTTELNNIKKRYMAAAPSCIESGVASSTACASVWEADTDLVLEFAVLKRAGCNAGADPINPHFSYLVGLVEALPKVKNNATAATNEPVCISQIPDIERKYNLGSVKWIPNGGSSDYTDMFLCYYSAVSSTDTGSVFVIVLAGKGDVNIGYAAKDPRNTFSIRFERLINQAIN